MSRRREQARERRERLRAEREAQTRRERRNRRLLIAGSVLGVIVVVIAVVVVTQMSRPEDWQGAPVSLRDDGSAVMAEPGVSGPVVDIYEDPQCPACKEWEDKVAPTVKKLTEQGKAKAVFHPITIFPTQLNDGVTRANSIRAGAALRCAPEDRWLAYFEKLFEEQPPEHEEGFRPEDLAAWGKDAGITAPGFEKCATSQEKAGQYESESEKTMKEAAIKGTPTIKIDGTEVANDVAFDPSSLEKAVLDAAK